MEKKCNDEGIIFANVPGFEGPATVSGCELVEVERHENCEVLISKCGKCGHLDITWSKKKS